ncbi:UNVERIFIED_CONTAM: flavodoxin short chain [Acetivibrio alkalicellulosi]
MKKVAVIFWSGTGNTEKMAEAVAEGAREAGAEVKLLPVEKATKDDVLSADALALGCPSMGAEVLEEEEMEPFVEEIEKENIKDKPMILFGSYDWGDGQWMKDWEERMKSAGVNLLDDGLIVQNTPDDFGLNLCKELGKKTV